MFTELGDLDEDEDKENTPGTKLFTLSKDVPQATLHSEAARGDITERD